MDSPVGRLTITEEDGAVTSLCWGGYSSDTTRLLADAREQLERYFHDGSCAIDVPVHICGSTFLRNICSAMSAIPAGETRTYGEIARDLGVSAQAAGQGCGANPVPILVPCHRVLAADSLGGYSGAGGIETKVWLLKHEGAAGLLI